MTRGERREQKRQRKRAKRERKSNRKALRIIEGIIFGWMTPETQLTSYTWYMKTNGKVQSYLKTDDTKEGFQELFP